MLTGGKHQRFWLLEVTKLDKKNGMCLLFSWIVADSDWLITQGMKINICTDFTKCRSYAENAAGSFWSSVRLNSDLWLIRDKEYKDSFYLFKVLKLRTVNGRRDSDWFICKHTFTVTVVHLPKTKHSSC